MRSLGNTRTIIALLVVGLMVLVPAIFVVWSLSAASVIADSNRQQAETLESLQSRLTALSASANSAKANLASVYLPGKSQAIAGAALQRIIATTVEGAGGRVVQSEITRGAAPGEEPEPGAVSLRAEFDTDIVGLQKIIFALETGAPILTVQSLTVEAGNNTSADATNPGLSVVLMIRGNWEA